MQLFCLFNIYVLLVEKIKPPPNHIIVLATLFIEKQIALFNITEGDSFLWIKHNANLISYHEVSGTNLSPEAEFFLCFSQ
jgi:hypothetical protein